MKASVITCAAILALATVSLLAQDGAGPTTQPAATTEPADPQAEADDLVRQLLTRPQTRILNPAPTTTQPTSAPASQPAVAPSEVMRPIPLPPGAIIADRVGRLVPEEGTNWWTFHFESEQNVLREGPIRILPNRLLERMETISREGQRAGVRFRISGEVTQYRGERYLLLRKFIVEHNLGALQP